MRTLTIITFISILVATTLASRANTSQPPFESGTMEMPTDLTDNKELHEKVLYKVPKEFLELNTSSQYKRDLVLSIHKSVDEYGLGLIDEWDLWAVSHKESSWKHRKINGNLTKGDGGASWGLCQIQSNWSSNGVLKDFYRGYGIKLPDKFDRSNLEDNIACCVAILAMGYEWRTASSDPYIKIGQAYTYYNEGRGKKHYVSDRYGVKVRNNADRFRTENNLIALEDIY